MKKMKSNRSCAYDGINTKIIQFSSKEIPQPLTHIFNLTFSTGIISDDLKIALISPIF